MASEFRMLLKNRYLCHVHSVRNGGMSGIQFAPYEPMNPLGIESGMTESIPLRGDFEPCAAQFIEFGP